MRNCIAILLLSISAIACKKRVEPVIVQPDNYTYKTSGVYEGRYVSRKNSMTSRDTVRLIFSKDNHPLNTIKYRVIGIEKTFEDYAVGTTGTNKDYYIDIDENANIGNIKDTLDISSIASTGFIASYKSRGVYSPYLSFSKIN